MDLGLDLQHSLSAHTTHSIIGLRGGRIRARSIRIMLMYGISCHRNIPISYLALVDLHRQRRITGE